MQHRRRHSSHHLFVALLGLILGVFMPLFSTAAEMIEADHVRISWLAPEQFANNKSTTTIGIYFEVDPEWHVYWRNSGDSGAAPRFNLNGQGLQFDDVQWPFPQRLPIAHLTNLGYESDVAYLFDVDTTKLTSKEFRLTAELEWLVCKEDCIPGFGTLELTRPVADVEEWTSTQQTKLLEFQQRIPQSSENSPWKIQRSEFNSGANTLTLTLRAEDASDARLPDIFPMDGGFITAAAPKQIQTSDVLSLEFSTISGVATPQTTGFVLVVDERAWEFSDVAVEETQAVSSQTPAPTSSLPVLLFFAVLGGIILNLMPCVFPVLSIKLFSLVRTSGESSHVREGLLYSAGVIITFAAIGALFLFLRASGAAIGWGFQLQSPWVVLALILLFWLMALSFLGAVEFGHGIMRLAGAINGKVSHKSSSFMTGALAVFVAAPCTGPFMGAALGASSTLPALQAMSIFIGLGVGLAAPYFLISISPQLISRLPKPGPWMETLRQFLAFPLFATVLWLLWVLGHLLDASAWIITTTLLLVIGFSLWLGKSHARWIKIFALLLAIAAIGYSVAALKQVKENPVSENVATDWPAYDEQALKNAQTKGQAVFVDFTAAWCITCQVNKKLVLDTETVQDLFAKNNVLALRADWTNHDQNITDALAKFGRNSVPVYVFYPADGAPPKILPQILTFDEIRKLF